MDQKILDWLLSGPWWLKYAVESQLLDQKPEFRFDRLDEPVLRIIRELKDDQGMRTIKDLKHSCYGKIYWDLNFLGDIGFTLYELDLENEAREIFRMQADDGTFITMRDMKPRFFCIPTILLTPLKKMGWPDEPELKRFLQPILESIRLDGGWHCALQRAKGRKLQDSESCPMDNSNILMLLGQFEEYRNDPRFNGAIDLLLRHWDRREEKWRPYGFGIGTDFLRLKYPAVKYGILRVLDVLSLFPYAVKQKSFQNMMKELRQKSQEGMYSAESVVHFFSDFDFGQKKEPSRWLTFLVERIEKRISQFN